MPFSIIRNDITKVRADAIVDTANPEAGYGSGTDCAIYKAAGEEKLLEERRKIGDIRTGEVAVTAAFDLPAKYIIHTVGPVWTGGGHNELVFLRSCYKKSLLIARQLGCRSIAFPLIAAGNYGFPKDKALAAALDTIGEFLRGDNGVNNDDMDVTLVVFDRGAFDLSAALITDVKQFIDEKYVEEKRKEEADGAWAAKRRELARRQAYGQLAEMASRIDASKPAASDKGQSLEETLRHMSETYQEALLRMIDEKKMTDTEVYKKANLDRKLFSKIRCNRNYTPKKKTALALAVALELNKDQTLDLLRRAGLTLSPSSKSDLIVEYCIEHKIYNIFEVNALLFEYDQPMIGS